MMVKLASVAACVWVRLVTLLVGSYTSEDRPPSPPVWVTVMALAAPVDVPEMTNRAPAEVEITLRQPPGLRRGRPCYQGGRGNAVRRREHGLRLTLDEVHAIVIEAGGTNANPGIVDLASASVRARGANSGGGPQAGGIEAQSAGQSDTGPAPIVERQAAQVQVKKARRRARTFAAVEGEASS